MIYDLSTEIDQLRYDKRYEQLKKNGSLVELSDVSKRSSNQNNYLHLILAWFAIEQGYALKYVKEEFYKNEVNSDIFQIIRKNKSGLEYVDFVSSADISKEEMTLSINRFRDWSATNGVYLPSADEKEFLKHIQKEESRMLQYL